jgi:hypothetical protein
MEFKECKICGNSKKDYEILRCKKCKRLVGCYDRGWIRNDGCAEYEAKQDKCERCGESTFLGFVWWEVAGRIS